MLYPVSVSIKNLGDARNEISGDGNRHFGLLPHVASISPTHGSTQGGTDITISGDGFLGSVSVAIDTVQCSVKSLAYYEIICTTSKGWAFSAPVKVTVRSDGNQLLANCSGACDYEFRNSDTAVVESVSPTTIASVDELLSIIGSGFGSSPSDVSVMLGSTPCSVQSIIDTNITCNAGEPIVGQHSLKVVIISKGAVNASAIGLISVTAAINTITPTSGSIKGGTLITLNGLGFKEGDTEILVGSSNCPVLYTSPVSVKCKSPPGTNGTFKVSLQSNSISYPLQDFSYLTTDTPTIETLSNTSGNAGETLVLSGNGFGSVAGDVHVTIDNAACNVTAITDTSISCTLGAHSAGEFPILLEREGKGIAAGDFDFQYELTLSGVSPNEGEYRFIGPGTVCIIVAFLNHCIS